MQDAAQADWTAPVAEVAYKTPYPRSNSWYYGSNIPGKPRQFGVHVGGFGNYSECCDAAARDDYAGFRLS